MKIETASELNFGKMGYIGKSLGRTTRKRGTNPYSSKINKFMEYYKKQVELIYNSFSSKDKDTVSQEFNRLDIAYHDQLAIIQRKKGGLSKAHLEY